MPFLKRLEGKELFGEVKKVLGVLTQGLVTFSKHQVTDAVRKNVGSELEVLHSDVRLEVENLMKQDTYKYEAKFDNTLGYVLYAPVYKVAPTTQTLNTSVSTPNGPVVTPAKSFSGVLTTAYDHLKVGLAKVFTPTAPTLTKVVKANKKGVCVPKELVEKALAAPNINAPGRVFVHLERPGGMSLVFTLQPDVYHNVTVLNSTLECKESDSFRLEVFGNGIHFYKV